MTKTVGIDRLQIQGGEPLTCSNLHKVVKATLDMPIKHIDIASNGTIIPDDLLLSTIKMLGDRGSFHISNYDCVDESRKSAVEKKVKEYGIDFYKYEYLYGTGTWFDSGKDNENRIDDDELLKKSYSTCSNHNCWVLAENSFVCCGKILTLMELKKSDDFSANNIINVGKARKDKRDFFYPEE